MTRLINTNFAAHWYDSTGKPCHDADVRRARKENLYPSVTTILQLLDKPALTSWKIEQGILAALTLPRLENEPIDDFAKRCAKDSQQQSKDAMDFGSKIHAAIEHRLSTKEPSKSNAINAPIDLWDYLNPVFTWIDENMISCESEKRLVNNEYYFAGQIDCIAKFKPFEESAIIDFKTKKTKPGESIYKADEYVYQLAAYGMLCEKFPDRFINVYISNTEPGRMDIVEYTKNEIEHGKSIFLDLCKLFRKIKKLSPYDKN